MNMRIFNTLKFKRQKTDHVSGHLKNTTTLTAYVPGVNSGVYEKKICITVHQKRPFKFNRWLKWKFGNEESMIASITLNEAEMISLQNEIKQILRLPFDE